MIRRTAVLLPLFLAPASNQGPPVTVIEHVTVLPMDGRDSLPDHSVVVRGESIERVAPSGTIRIPGGARRIDGRGRYLIPGLADMHVHPYDTDGLPSYLAFGVTTIAVMHGFPALLEWRDRIRRGELAGPTIYSAGPSVNGYPAGNPLFVSVEDPDGARAVVAGQHLSGYDFVKVYSMLNPSEYGAILAEAKRRRMPVFGHIPWQVGWRGIIEQGQAGVAHVEEFFNAGIQDSMFEEAAQLAAKHGTAVTANLYAYREMLAESGDIPKLLRDPEMRFHSPAGLSEKLPSSNRSLRPNQADFNGYLTRQLPRMRRLVKLLRDAGAPVFGGTDTETFGFAGQSLHGDLHELVLAGFTPYQALESATRLPGDFLRKHLPGAERSGTVTAGSRADLVLLDANPLRDLQHLQQVRGTMARGRWFAAEDLQRMRDSIAVRNARVHPLVALLDSLAMKANNGAEAVALFERVRETWPEVVPVAELVARGYGRTLFLKGDRPNAIKLRLRVAELYARSHSAANEVGRGYLFAGDTGNALVHFRRSLSISPHNSAVRRMVDKLEDSRRPLRFAALGRYQFGPVTMKGGEPATPRSLALTVSDSAGRRVGSIRWDDKDYRLDELVMGGERIWATVDVNDQTLELKLRVSGGEISGVWSYGWGNNGVIKGRASPHPRFPEPD
ncbi:MAG TPA: amidohydrolase family protein [Gemmatimonadales bacterium]|nr:amidohydrolase family protein [Gemmatimonadales bacterium]